jgi:hypothetical protein
MAARTHARTQGRGRAPTCQSARTLACTRTHARKVAGVRLRAKAHAHLHAHARTHARTHAHHFEECSSLKVINAAAYTRGAPAPQHVANACTCTPATRPSPTLVRSRWRSGYTRARAREHRGAGGDTGVRGGREMERRTRGNAVSAGKARTPRFAFRPAR